MRVLPGSDSVQVGLAQAEVQQDTPHAMACVAEANKRPRGAASAPQPGRQQETTTKRMRTTVLCQGTMTKRNNLGEMIRERVQEWHTRRAALQRGANGTVLGSPDHATAPGPEDDEPWPPEPWCSTYTQAVSRKAGVPRLTGQARDPAANASTNRQLKQALRRLPLEDSPAELICVAIFAVFVWPALPAWLVHTFRLSPRFSAGPCFAALVPSPGASEEAGTG